MSLNLRGLSAAGTIHDAADNRPAVQGRIRSGRIRTGIEQKTTDVVSRVAVLVLAHAVGSFQA